MCYSVYLSTNNPTDLAKYNTELATFQRISESDENPFTAMLKNPNKWYVGSKSGCSCTFRHLTSTELGFGEPVDWYPEEQENISATKELFRLISMLFAGGYCADIMSTWEGSEQADIAEMNIDLSRLNESTFRLFENHHFILFASTGSENKDGSLSEFP
jgi:hypothetical protein